MRLENRLYVFCHTHFCRVHWGIEFVFQSTVVVPIWLNSSLHLKAPVVPHSHQHLTLKLFLIGCIGNFYLILMLICSPRFLMRLALFKSLLKLLAPSKHESLTCSNVQVFVHFCSTIFFFFFFFLLFRATPAAYESSQARGRIRAVAASLHHSHSNRGSKPSLWPTHSSRQCWIPDPLSEARDQIHICFCCATMGTPCSPI